MKRTISHKRLFARRLRLLLAIALTATVSSLSAQAGEPTAPLASRNLSPLYANLGVPVLRDARTLARGEADVAWQLHWASHSLRAGEGGSTLEFDGETRRQDLMLRFGITDRLSLEASLPFVDHDGGRLDRLIDGWHGFWGLPYGYRDEQPRDALRLAYTGQEGFAVERRVSGLGDAEAGLSWQVINRHGMNLSPFVQVKFATGDLDRLTGSGETAYSLGLRGSVEGCLLPSLTCHGQIGVADVGSPAYAVRSFSAAGFASFSMVWSLNDALALIGQVDAQTVVYRDAPLDTSGAPVWGSLGLRWSVAEHWTFDAQFSEDLVVGAAPDITFILGLARRL